MRNSVSTLRPVGNPVLTRKGPLDHSQFGNLNIRFYQSGTAALAASLIAVKLFHEKVTNVPEVILPAYACPDLISACVYAGVKPVLVDLEADSCWLSLAQIEKSITKNTIGLIAVRFLGIAERMPQLQEICSRHSLILIEDSAQGFPTHNPESYWQGDLAILSFGRGKPINLLGGGAVLIRNSALKHYLSTIEPVNEPTTPEKITYRLKIRAYNLLIKPSIYGIATRLPTLHVGETTYKQLTEIKSIGTQMLAFMDANISQYKHQPRIADRIHQRMAGLNTGNIIDLPERAGYDYINPLLRYPLLVKKKSLRDTLFHALQKLGASTMYQRPLYQIEGIPDHVVKNQAHAPNAENFAQQLLTLPTHTDVSDKLLDQMIDILTCTSV